ncbi:hypothetical protein ACOB87_00675 [Streptomyces sp. YS-B37]|uniref:hypothetical protein n=1 Tax=Streptomyces sp. YS-B37 TaxID=3407669 RepID=UPI003B502157
MTATSRTGSARVVRRRPTCMPMAARWLLGPTVHFSAAFAFISVADLIGVVKQRSRRLGE